jgi:hypothetical protein
MNIPELLEIIKKTACLKEGKKIFKKRKNENYFLRRL